MATTYKSAQLAAPGASVTTYGTLYTSTGVQAVISTILVCNTSNAPVVFRIGLMGSAGTPAVASGQFLAYDTPVAANDTLSLSWGITMDAGEFLRVSAAATDINFTAFVGEVS